MPRLHIILTCDGGAGHKSAAEALRAEALAANDTAVVINTTRTGWFSGGGLDITYEYDHLFPAGLVDLGPFATRWWDWAQRNSQVELLRFFANLRKLSVLSIPSFRHRTYCLLKERQDIDTYTDVIFHNTQPNCLQALVFSVARYNREINAYNEENPGPRRNTVRYVNHFTDMPTLHAEMFIEEIAKINVSDLNDAQFELRTRPPIIENKYPSLLTSNDYESIYHKKTKKFYPNLYLDLLDNQTRVKFVDGPIRSEFLLRKDSPALRQDGICIQFKDQQEFARLNNSLSNTMSAFDPIQSNSTIPLDEDVEVVSLMLGSQASIEGTLSLVQEELTVVSASHKVKYVFVFCGENRPQDGLVLYQKVLDIAETVNKAPDSLIRILPLTNQPGKMIANLYSLADRVITRPGGISIMEIEAVAKRANIFVFTELSKLDKLFNTMLNRSVEDLEQQYSLEKSYKRFSDLVAWEAGNALHAQNACKDISGRTRVVPVNVYTFRKELTLMNKKERIVDLLNKQQYSVAFDELSSDAALNAFFMTGDDVGVDLACLVEVSQLYRHLCLELSDLIQKNKSLVGLKNGPQDTLDMITMGSHAIVERLMKNEEPVCVLKDALSQTAQIKGSLDHAIKAVKKSNIENKGHIIMGLEFLSRAFLNFFRFIFRLKPAYEPIDELKNIRKDIFAAINRPSMSKLELSDDDKALLYQPLVDTDVNKLQWSALDRIIANIIQTAPLQKHKTFRIKKEDYPELMQDFLYCGRADGDEPSLYAICKTLGRGYWGVTSFLQNRHGTSAVMKEYFPIVRRGIVPVSESNELRSLNKMHVLIHHDKCSYLGEDYSSDYISIQKYIPGQTLKRYLMQDNLSWFQTKKVLSDSKKYRLSVSIAVGLKHLIDKGITHGDIHSDNLLIQENGEHEISSTFVDFGLSQMEKYPRLNYKPDVPPNISAPELLRARRLHEEQEHGGVTGSDNWLEYPYSDKSDIYSLGILFKDLGIDPTLTQKMTAEKVDDRPNINEVLSTLADQLNALEENVGFEERPMQQHASAVF